MAIPPILAVLDCSSTNAGGKSLVVNKIFFIAVALTS
jgi:hypothetical protein